MYGGKPAVVDSYTVLEEDNDIAIWQATTYDGQIILDLKDKRYITTQRTFYLMVCTIRIALVR